MPVMRARREVEVEAKVEAEDEVEAKVEVEGEVEEEVKVEVEVIPSFVMSLLGNLVLSIAPL